MKKYIEVSPVKKLRLLNEHSVFKGAEWSHLDQTRWCLHCEKEFNGHSVRVYEEGGQVWLECGTPQCDGSPIDWANQPWWDPDHPLTKKYEAEMEQLMREEGVSLPKKKKRKR